MRRPVPVDDGGSSDKHVRTHGVRPASRHSSQNLMRRALVLLVAGVWLALAGIALSGAASAGQTAPRASAAPFDLCATQPVPPTCTPTAIPTIETPTATPTKPGGKPTPSTTPSVTVTSTPTTAPPTATSGGNGGGGGGGGNGGDVGPQPTKVVSQLPSAGGSGDGALGGLSPGAFGSNGLLLATTSSCIVGLLGLLIAAIALSVLLRGGYGPFLKTLLRGKRAGQARGARGGKGDIATANANTSSNRYGSGAKRDDFGGGGGWSEPRGSRGGDARRQSSPSRSRSRGASRDGW